MTQISTRVIEMIDAPVDKLNDHRRLLEADGVRVLNLGQAIPDFGPPPEAVEALADQLRTNALNRYTADAGLPELRAAVAVSLSEDRTREPVSPDEIIITAGANHAFLVACATIINSGDAVGLLAPRFINHGMTVQGLGGRPIDILPNDEFVYDPSEVLRMIQRHRMKALVIVNPSNPTGRLYPDDELRHLCSICKRSGTWLIVDEVYRRFTYSGHRHSSVLAVSDTGAHLITLGSFSKEYGMTGWRVGWLRVPRDVQSQFLKTQDHSVICAPHPSQALALHALRIRPDWAASHLPEYGVRRDAALQALRSSNAFDVYEGQGAFFVWFRPRRTVKASTVVAAIMRTSHVCVMPGGIFGSAFDDWFRLSYGTASIQDIRTGIRLLTEQLT